MVCLSVCMSLSVSLISSAHCVLYTLYWLLFISRLWATAQMSVFDFLVARHCAIIVYCFF